MADVTDALEARGHLQVVSAGNYSQNADVDFPLYPSSLPNSNIISVAAAQYDGKKVLYSSYGPVSVDLSAPTGFVATQVNNGYITTNGTSLSAPLVTGAIALAWSQNIALTAAEMKQAVLKTARISEDWSSLTVTGGIIDLKHLLEAVQDTDNDGLSNFDDLDDDGDGVTDDKDFLPLDPNETQDTDGDGIGDNTDLFPNDANQSEHVPSDPLSHEEMIPGRVPMIRDTDQDGLDDEQDDHDHDNDGIPNVVESDTGFTVIETWESISGLRVLIMT